MSYEFPTKKLNLSVLATVNKPIIPVSEGSGFPKLLLKDLCSVIMAVDDIEAFMNDSNDDEFLKACDRLEQRSGTMGPCIDSAEPSQVHGVHGSASGSISETFSGVHIPIINIESDGSEEWVPAEAISELNSCPISGRRVDIQNTAVSDGTCAENHIDENIPPECPEGSLLATLAEEGVSNPSATAACSSEKSKCEVDGKRPRGKLSKRRKSENSDTEEDDIVERYMRKSDQKYAFNKTDPSHPPLFTLRHGHLAASDFAALLWCEQRYVYNKTVPARVRREKVPEPEYVAAGTVLHRERELAIQQYVPVKTTSAEDSFSVEYSNTLLFMRRLLQQEKPVVREVRVMGEIDGVLICGIIDELRVADVDDFAIDLVEFKTRSIQTLPRKAQKETHDLQVMLYKYMIDDMIRGRCLDDHLAKLGLDINASLGEAVSSSIQNHCTRRGGVPFSSGKTWTVRRLFEEMRLVMQALPFIRSCFVNYTFQEDGETFHENEVVYDEGWLLSKLSHGLAFWRGERGSEGVDVEEAWKCRLCPYQDHCWWVRHKSEQLQRQNQQRHGTTPLVNQSGEETSKAQSVDSAAKSSETTDF